MGRSLAVLSNWRAQAEAKPSELSVQLPTKFELIVNLKAAKAIGLSVLSTLLFRADDVERGRHNSSVSE
jgi:hypothetical protein